MFVEKRIEGERDMIERISESERKYGINSRGLLAYLNAYGEMVSIYKDGTELPVICGHGGSAWLCRDCKDELLRKQQALAEARLKFYKKTYKPFVEKTGKPLPLSMLKRLKKMFESPPLTKEQIKEEYEKIQPIKK